MARQQLADGPPATATATATATASGAGAGRRAVIRKILVALVTVLASWPGQTRITVAAMSDSYLV